MQVAGGEARGGVWHSTKPPISFAMKGSQEGRCFFVDFIFPVRKIGRFIKNHQCKLSTYWAVLEEVCPEREGRCRGGHWEVLIRGIDGR